MKAKRQRAAPIREPALFPLEAPHSQPEKAFEIANMAKVERPFSLPGILLGTSSFTAAGWEGSFYPAGMKQREFLSYYAMQFSTVEVDGTFYGTPSASTVTGWREKTPADFVFEGSAGDHA